MLTDDLWTMDLGGIFIHMVLSISIWVRKFETCQRSRYLKLRCCKRTQKCDERIPKRIETTKFKQSNNSIITHNNVWNVENLIFFVKQMILFD